MKKIAFILGFVAFIAACSSNDNGDSDTTPDDGFDKTAMLTNWADNIIIPAYTNYQAKTQDLIDNANAFTATPTEANLQIVRTSWIEAYKAYQYVAIYNFGKAPEILFKERTNTYPTNVTGIKTNISSGTYDLSLLSQVPKQGLPAIDYMLNGLAADDASIVAFYSTNTNAANYKKYLIDLANVLKSNVDVVLNSWNTGYRNAYITNNGNLVSSSVNITVNSFVQSYEKDVRAAKVAYPAGVFSEGALYPEQVEAYYKNDLSKDLLNVSVQATQDFFNGKNFNNSATGPSLKSYLDYLNSVRNGQNLSDIINGQYQTIFTKNDDLDNSFSKQINTDNSKMLASFDALQQLVVYFKLDMMQALNISVDYADNDGD